MYIEYEDMFYTIYYKDIDNIRHTRKVFSEREVIEVCRDLSGRRDVQADTIYVQLKQRVMLFNEDSERMI